jgi:hypothetical protein
MTVVAVVADVDVDVHLELVVELAIVLMMTVTARLESGNALYTLKITTDSIATIQSRLITAGAATLPSGLTKRLVKI